MSIYKKSIENLIVEKENLNIFLKNEISNYENLDEKDTFDYIRLATLKNRIISNENFIFELKEILNI